MNTHVSRRGVIRTAAWSAPAVTVVAVAPAYAANSANAATLQLIAPTVSPFNSVDLSASQRTVTVRVLDSSSQPVPNATVNFSVDVTGGTWDIFYDGAGSRNDASLGPTAGVTTKSDGYATTSYGYSAPPAVPSTTTATFTASCGAAAPVQFVVGHLPLQALVTHARAQHGLALAGGKAFAWGEGPWGRLGNGDADPRLIPTPVDTSGALNGRVIMALACGQYHSIGSDNNLYSFGVNGAGQLGNGTVTNAITAAQVTHPGPVTAIAAGTYHSVALVGGKVYVWGYNQFGQVRPGSPTNTVSPVGRTDAMADTSIASKTITTVGAGHAHSLAVDSNGAVHLWGNGLTGGGTVEDGISTVNNPSGTATSTKPLDGHVVANALAGDGVVFARDSAGVGWGWGNGSNGRLGNGSADSVNYPAEISMASFLP